jgi:hypothetical protein
MGGNLAAGAELADRSEGKPSTRLAVQQEGPNPLDLWLAELRVLSDREGPPEGQPLLEAGDSEDEDKIQ